MVKKVNKSILHQCPNLVLNIYNNLLHGVKLKEGYFLKLISILPLFFIFHGIITKPKCSIIDTKK